MKYDLTRRLCGEGIGSLGLVCGVVGSGIMADALTDDVALALLANTLATGALLMVLIAVLGPVSGAHFNPAVSLAFYLRRQLCRRETGLYVLVQICGGVAGSLLAHGMFEKPLFQLASTARMGVGLWLSEGVATFGLVSVILVSVRVRSESVPWLVGLYIVSAYWFTASTSFANPAVAIARAFTDTFAGIRPIDVPAFILAQLAGALLATACVVWLFRAYDRGAIASVD